MTPTRGLIAPLVVALLLAAATTAFGTLTDALTVGLTVLLFAALTRIAPAGHRDHPPTPPLERPGGARPDLDLLARDTWRTDRTVNPRAVARTLDLVTHTLHTHGIDPLDPAHAGARARILGDDAPPIEQALAASPVPSISRGELDRWLTRLEVLNSPQAVVPPSD